MSLTEQIASKAKEIHTDGYAMSIGEVISLYKDGDIEIHPEFQRIFRWTDEQKSRLVESILLSIPIPPIFVSQREDGVWDVIDGVQRLSTVFEFVGLYTNERGELSEPLTLVGTEYLPDLDGYQWEGEAEDKVFSDSLRRDLKRSKLEFRIIRKESDSNAKFDMFQRLNAGTHLSQQEARNCLLVMINRQMYSDITRLADDADFRAVCLVSEAKENEAYHQELVLRFFCQMDYAGAGAELPSEFGEYVTNWMRRAADSYASEASSIDSELFRRTFSLLGGTMGEDAFRPWNGRRHLGPFSISSFEFVTTGVGANIDYWEGQPEGKLSERIKGIWSSVDFKGHSGTGVSPRRRVPKLVLNARRYFSA